MLGVLHPGPQQRCTAAAREGLHEGLALSRATRLLRLNPQQLVGDVLWGPEMAVWATAGQNPPTPGTYKLQRETQRSSLESAFVLSIPGILQQGTVLRTG